MKKIAILLSAAALMFSWCVPDAMAHYRHHRRHVVNTWNTYPVYSGRTVYIDNGRRVGWVNRRNARAWRNQVRREQRAWRFHQRQAARWNGWY